ncbi:PREDICTED: probable threonine--tRNA ligase 2, cytoplasmic [Hipposideros armiger]|uniref:threonine--tRNA ligase n=1 Tax=Hipposideros armiger TaxID=186990 RepID=A0A8B7QYJ9_HIPAR|nr:PREDICTED: probable threonine--tRNA ligase 2, cytoplasmic [Hipposideros armiger]
MAAEALAAEAVASRLARQEEDIRWLWAEVQRLRDEQLNAPDQCQAEGPCLTREVTQLRAENRDLRYRLYRLRLCLAEELSHQMKLERAARAAAQEEAERATAGVQPPSSQKQEKDIKKKKVESGPNSEVKNQSNFINERLKLFEMLKKEHQLLSAVYEKKGNTSNTIRVRLADGKTVEGEVWKTTPYQVAADISQELAESTVVAKVNGELWDLDRPLEGDSKLELLMFDNEEAQATFLTLRGSGSSAVTLYFMSCSSRHKAVSSTELSALENICKAILKEKQPFERLEVSKEVLLEMFKYSKFKCRILNEKVNTPTTTVYRCGSLIDLCKGPHVRHTGKIKTIKIFKNSSTYWEGNSEMETLQRIYGISFPDNKMMKTWEKFREEARSRDHRKVGKEQELFFFHDLSPGSCFFLPRGAFIYNTLMDFIREEYHRRNFTEVLSPNMYNSKLWEASGHWQHYSANMFTFNVEKDTFALKPMNCPGHCLMFAHRPRSWREMPIRFADFGVLHRNELSGTLSGLTRVRRFQQDDAHIFCTVEQKSRPGSCKDGDDKKNPVIIHRAILGSVERMIAILSENYGGKWPFWLSPRQVMIIPVGPTCEKYALQVSSEFFEEGFMTDVDLDHSCTLNKKIRNAQLAQYNFILVVGENEKTNHAVNVRTRDNKIHGAISVTSAIDKLKNLKISRTPNAEEEF